MKKSASISKTAKGRKATEGEELHKLLTGLFGRGGFQPFRLKNSSKRGALIYGVSRLPLDELCALARGVGTPEMLAKVDLDAAASKPLPSEFPKGTLIGIDLRACPIVRLSAGGEMDAYRHYLTKWDPSQGEKLDKATVYERWLREKLAPAGKLEEVRIRHAAMSFERRKGKTFRTPEVRFYGTLKIEDGAAFSELLEKGVGRGKAYGFGLLMPRPPHQTAK